MHFSNLPFYTQIFAADLPYNICTSLHVLTYSSTTIKRDLERSEENRKKKYLTRILCDKVIHFGVYCGSIGGLTEPKSTEIVCWQVLSHCLYASAKQEESFSMAVIVADVDVDVDADADADADAYAYAYADAYAVVGNDIEPK
uniref:Uncharacterized protein n=1 Tax=Glossina brevipalpis TaxID=37001 RepID=A0A1A9WZ67_9MUSC